MALPFLPGNSFNPRLGKTQFHKSHHLDYANDMFLDVGEAKPGIGGEPRLGQNVGPKNSVFPRGVGPESPAWVAFDRQVLSFDAYFQEAVHEKREEQYRIRNCKIYFYLEDDSIQVLEPRIKNSGIPQGTLIRRHHIHKPPPNDDQFYTVEDFNIGKTITFYSRTFEITDCDEFTENFLKKMGLRIGNKKQIPRDPYPEYRKAMEETMQPLRPYEKEDTLKQFLDHDRQVLRFYCHWDDSDSMFGDPREMVLHYFLADDTIEIREIVNANSGRDATPMFLHRQRLTKDVQNLHQPGESTKRTVLNVFGPTGHGGRYILDSLKTGAISNDFYHHSDLTLGTILNVLGRRFILCDCDDFTKEYYRSKYGIHNFTPIQYKAGASQPEPRQMPPYNGFGSEEDSLCSCKGFMPKPPKRDFIKFMEKDRQGLDGHVLRFLAKMATNKPLDQDRSFIVSYYLSDDTLQVFEPAVRNSGIMSGKFIERGRMKKPDQPRFSTELSEYYLSQDLYVGAMVDFNNHRFFIIAADEYAYNYMERHGDEYQQANIAAIMSKLRTLATGRKEDVLRQMNPGGTGCSDSLPEEAFIAEMHKLVGNHLTAHEVQTIARAYAGRKEHQLDLDNLVAIAQDQLRKVNYENFGPMYEHCKHLDSDRTGFLPFRRLRAASHAFKIPIPDDLLCAIMTANNTDKAIPYELFIKQLNWRDAPVAPPVMRKDSNLDPNEWTGIPERNQVSTINYKLLMQDVFNLAGGSAA